MAERGHRADVFDGEPDVVAPRRERRLRETAQAFLGDARARVLAAAVALPGGAVVDLRVERAGEPTVGIRRRAAEERDADHLLRRLGELRVQRVRLLERGGRPVQVRGGGGREGVRVALARVAEDGERAVDPGAALREQRDPRVGAGRRERLAERGRVRVEELREDPVDRARPSRERGVGRRPRRGGRAERGGMVVRRVERLARVGGEEALERRARDGAALQLRELRAGLVVPVPLVLPVDGHPREERVGRPFAHREIVGAPPPRARGGGHRPVPAEQQLARDVVRRLREPRLVAVGAREQGRERLVAQQGEELLVAEARVREEGGVRADAFAPPRERGLVVQARPRARRGRGVRLRRIAGFGRERAAVPAAVDEDVLGGERREREPGRDGGRVRRPVAVDPELDRVRPGRDAPSVDGHLEALNEERPGAPGVHGLAVLGAEAADEVVFAGDIGDADGVRAVVADARLLGSVRGGFAGRRNGGREEREEQDDSFHGGYFRAGGVGARCFRWKRETDCGGCRGPSSAQRHAGLRG